MPKTALTKAWLQLDKAMIWPKERRSAADLKRRGRPKKKRAKPDPERAKLRKEEKNKRVKAALAKKPKYSKLPGTPEQNIRWGRKVQVAVLVACPYCKAPKGYKCITVGPNCPRDDPHIQREKAAKGVVKIFVRKIEDSGCVIRGCYEKDVYEIDANNTSIGCFCRKHATQIQKEMAKIMLGLIK